MSSSSYTRSSSDGYTSTVNIDIRELPVVGGDRRNPNETKQGWYLSNNIQLCEGKIFSFFWDKIRGKYIGYKRESVWWIKFYKSRWGKTEYRNNKFY